MTTTLPTTARTAATRVAGSDRRTADGMLRDIAFVLEMTRRMRSESRVGRPAAANRVGCGATSN